MISTWTLLQRYEIKRTLEYARTTVNYVYNTVSFIVLYFCALPIFVMFVSVN